MSLLFNMLSKFVIIILPRSNHFLNFVATVNICSDIGAQQNKNLWKNSSRKNDKAGPNWKWHSVVNVSGGESKIWCCKEQYCIGTWNVRCINQGKLDVVKPEIVRVNINILGISDLKWMEMGEFNSDDHYIYYCGHESLRGNGVALIVNKRVPNAVLWCNLKNFRMISFHFQRKPFNITVI